MRHENVDSETYSSRLSTQVHWWELPCGGFEIDPQLPLCPDVLPDVTNTVALPEPEVRPPTASATNRTDRSDRLPRLRRQRPAKKPRRRGPALVQGSRAEARRRARKRRPTGDRL